MNAYYHMRRYQRQAAMTATPEQLIAKLYDIGIQACHRQDLHKARAAVSELMSSLNMEAGGELAQRLYALYEFCLLDLAEGRTQHTREILEGLRAAWREGVLKQKAA